MSDLNLNLDDLKDIEEAIKNSPESPCSEEDKREIERYNKRKEQVAKFKEDIKKVEELCDKDWAKVILKSSTKNMMLAQILATDEIEEYPDREIEDPLLCHCNGHREWPGGRFWKRKHRHSGAGQLLNTGHLQTCENLRQDLRRRRCRESCGRGCCKKTRR